MIRDLGALTAAPPAGVLRMPEPSAYIAGELGGRVALPARAMDWTQRFGATAAVTSGSMATGNRRAAAGHRRQESALYLGPWAKGYRVARIEEPAWHGDEGCLQRAEPATRGGFRSWVPRTAGGGSSPDQARKVVQEARRASRQSQREAAAGLLAADRGREGQRSAVRADDPRRGSQRRRSCPSAVSAPAGAAS